MKNIEDLNLRETMEYVADLQSKICEYERFEEWLFFVLGGDKDREAFMFDNILHKTIVDLLRKKGLLEDGNA